MSNNAAKREAGEGRTERMELRIRPSAKDVVQRAMAVSGLSAADLAYMAAKQVLAEHERILLSGRDRDEFLDLILNPPEPADALRRAFARHRRATG